jgi:hypothetical protein
MMGDQRAYLLGDIDDMGHPHQHDHAPRIAATFL